MTRLADSLLNILAAAALWAAFTGLDALIRWVEHEVNVGI